MSRGMRRFAGLGLVWILGALLGPVALLAQTDGSWQIETVKSADGAQVGGFAALVIDQGGSLHAAYYDYTHAQLLYSFRGKNDKNWSTTTVDGKGRGTYVSLAVDANGQPHMAYNSMYEDGLHYATWDGHRWKRQLIDSEHINYYTSIQLDKDGNPRISYYLYHAPDKSYLLRLKFASFNGQYWTIQTLDKRMGTGKFNSIAVDAEGHPHIAYSHVSLGDLLYAAWDGSQWNFADVDSRRTHNDYVGIGSSIALDSAGNAHIAYFDETQNLVKYAWLEEGRWKNEVVEHLGSRGELDHVSLQVDHQNRPHLAFYDAGIGALKYAIKDDKGWHSEVVDKDGNVGKNPSLVLDAKDQPYIAYYALDEGALRVAHLATATVAALASEKK